MNCSSCKNFKRIQNVVYCDLMFEYYLVPTEIFIKCYETHHRCEHYEFKNPHIKGKFNHRKKRSKIMDKLIK